MQIQNVRNNQQNQTFGAIKITPKNPADILLPTAIDAMIKSADEVDSFIGQGLKNDVFSINILTQKGSEQEKNVMSKLVENLKENFNLFKFESINDETAKKEGQNFEEHMQHVAKISKGY